MLYIYLDGFIDDHYVGYEKKVGIKNAIETESEIVDDLIKAVFREK